MSEQPENNIDLHRLKLRTLTPQDYDDVKEIMQIVYADAGGAWTEKEFKNQLRVFPEGQIGIEVEGKVVAAALSLILDYAKFGDNHTYDQITGEGRFDTQDYEGDTLYGTDLFVHPGYRDMRLGRRLYDARKELCENLNLRAIIVGGRLPGYKQYRDQMSPRKYVEEVKNKEIYDPVLSFQLANEFHLRKLISRYATEDKGSLQYATLLEWININYDESEKLIGGNKSNVRIGAVQWQMRPVHSLEDMLQQVEFFVDTVSSYSADFVLFPEFFNAPLMALAHNTGAADAVRSLAEYTDEIRDKMQELAIAYNINIIAGSMPVYEDHRLYNVSYILHRDGNIESQHKLHITPDEASYWGLQGGDSLRVFNTDAGRIGVLICYDVEFPELGRILADQKMDMLFVPYWTDTKNAYLRVRRCAQARAIENECYVIITGSVGNLPRVENMDIQYSQAAVFSPSDFSFPHDAVVAEATPNTETTLIFDLDLSLLKKLRTQGSVRNLQQRRKDLYQVIMKKQGKAKVELKTKAPVEEVLA